MKKTLGFGSKDIAAIAVISALWGVLNAIFSPMFFQIFGLPFLCDIIGFSLLAVAGWWIRKFGAITMIGVIATLITLIINPSQLLFLGFLGASIVFDLVLSAIGYGRIFKRKATMVGAVLIISIMSAAVAGYIIGSFFMPTIALVRWSGVLGWAALHSVGGMVGGFIGVFLILALIARKI